jgi:methylglyoxal synthase
MKGEHMKPMLKQIALRMNVRKRIALIAHDNRKFDLLEWARYNAGTLAQHELYATGTTGRLLTSELGLEVARFLSGPPG